MRTVTVSRVAQYRMPQVLHVATQLVGAPRPRLQFHQRKATIRITTYRCFDGGLIEAAVFGHSGLDFIWFLFVAQIIVDDALAIESAPHQRVIGLGNTMLDKELLCVARSFCIEGKQ